MLRFDRKEFRAGVQVVKELIQEEGQPDVLVTHKFYVKDKGKTFEFTNEDYLLQKYPILFTKV